MRNTQLARTPSKSFVHWHTVLIVDDQAETLEALRRLLQREPYNVVTTDRPGLALAWLTTKNVSLVVSDQRMPEMDGDVFLEQVRKASPRTRLLLLTGYPDAVLRIPAARRSQLQVMTKPWIDERLKATVRTLLQELEEETEEKEAQDDWPADELGGEGG